MVTTRDRIYGRNLEPMLCVDSRRRMRRRRTLALNLGRAQASKIQYIFKKRAFERRAHLPPLPMGGEGGGGGGGPLWHKAPVFP
eukprot:SAG31_NODE_189_length_20842_cov_12.518151_23_plen_83_part_01